MSESAVSVSVRQRVSLDKVSFLALDYEHLRHALTLSDPERSCFKAFDYYTYAVTEISVYHPVDTVYVKAVFSICKRSGETF